MHFSKELIRWFEKNKRDLPWRHTTDPYPVWLSEIILQQTRVDQGMAYYHRFLELFPAVQDLADADEDAVMKAWQGLGYYSRARNLHYTAKFVAGELKGHFPTNLVGLIKLKGVGPYTAAAIASFCFGEVAPVIDGNVMRVLSRIHGISEPIDSSAGKKIMTETAQRLIDRDDPGTYNQAIMEFGAIHCTPQNPKCESCPFSQSCVAYRTNAVASFPVKGKKTTVKELWLYYFFLIYKEKTYLRKRTGNGIWKGLHDFPSIESDRHLIVNDVIGSFLTDSDLVGQAEVKAVTGEVIHVLTHRRIHARFVTLELKSPWKKPAPGIFMPLISELKDYGVSRLVDRFLESGSDERDLFT